MLSHLGCCLAVTASARSASKSMPPASSSPALSMLSALQDIPLEVVFEDEHLMVVNKPAGMVVHPSAGHWEEGTLVHALLHYLQRPAIDLTDTALSADAGSFCYIVHRTSRPWACPAGP